MIRLGKVLPPRVRGQGRCKFYSESDQMEFNHVKRLIHNLIGWVNVLEISGVVDLGYPY